MKRFLRQNWKWILGFAAVFLLALGLRVYHLTLLPVFVDEAIYIRWSQIMSNEATLRFLPLSDGKQPLFMWILMFIVKRISDPLFAGRILSVASGMGTMVGVSVLGYVFTKSKKVAFIAGLIYAINPFVYFFDRLALVDSMLTMFGVWTFLFAILTAKTRRLDLAMITGFLLGCAMLTKSTAIFFAILLPATWIFVKGKKDLFKLIALNLVIFIIVFGMYNILRLGPNFNLITSRNQDYIYPLTRIITNPLDPFMGHLGGVKNYFYLMGPVSLVVIWLLSYLVNYKKYLRELFTLTIWGIGPILVTMEYFKVVTARYIVYTIPFFIILASLAFSAKSKLVQKLAYLGLFIFIVQSLFFDYKLLTNVASAPLPEGERSGFLQEWTAGDGIKEISEYVKNVAKDVPSGRQVTVGTEGYFGTLPDGLQMYVQAVDKVVVIGVGLGIDKVPDSLVASKKSGNKTYLVINKSRLTGDPEEMGLKLIATYTKIPRAPGTRDYTQIGPQEFLYFFEY